MAELLIVAAVLWAGLGVVCWAWLDRAARRAEAERIEAWLRGER